MGAFLLVLASPVPAFAQPEVWASSPEDGALLDTAPGEIAVTFSETLDGASTVAVAGPDRVPLELEPPRFSENVLIQGMRYPAVGAYTVTVTAVFADGQELETVFSFSVESVPEMLAVDGVAIEGEAADTAGTGESAAPSGSSGDSGSNLVLLVAILAAALVIVGGIPAIRRMDRRRRSTGPA
ncbi:hypothetical protein GCM10009853_030150 [Glycomyces scopariae]